jgi:hypothetical protein
MSGNQALIFLVVPNPEPYDHVPFENAERSIIPRDSHSIDWLLLVDLLET